MSSPRRPGNRLLHGKTLRMPIKYLFTRKAYGRRCRHHALRGVAALCLGALVVTAARDSAQARTQENLAIATPFEVGESPSGNYLAALVAGAEHDTVAAATFFREALRFDPRNPNLIERAFIAAVSNGNMQDAFGLADRLIVHDPNNSLARLALGIKAIKAKQFAAARAYFAKGGTSQQRDITATLLTAWTYAGSGDTSRALSLVDKLRGENFGVFRDYPCRTYRRCRQ